MNPTETVEVEKRQAIKQGVSHMSRIEEGLSPPEPPAQEDVSLLDAAQGCTGIILLSGKLEALDDTLESQEQDDGLKNFCSCRDGFACRDEDNTVTDDDEKTRKLNYLCGQVDYLTNHVKQLDDMQERVPLIEKSSEKSKNDIEQNKKDIGKIEGQLKESSEEEPLLPEDTYSFIAITRPDPSCKESYLSFVWAILIFGFQILTLSLLAVDVIDRQNQDNKLGIPGNVDTQVRISQLIAIIITVISQDEVRLSLNVLYDGYDRNTVKDAFNNKKSNKSSDTGSIDHGTRTKSSESSGKQSGDRVMRTKWYVSILCRFIEGCLSLAVTFMLVVRATTVRDLLLNFTAVEFVSSVDDAIFLLSKWGYFGKTMRADAKSIENATMDKSEFNRCRQVTRTAFLFIIFLGMLGPWLWLSIEQAKGEYLEPIIYVQFGDEFSPALGTFSGVYRAEIPRPLRLFSGRRVDYVGHNGTARFSYCPSKRYWSFLYGESYIDTSLGECGNEGMIRALSSESYAFDITETASDQWFVKDDANYRNVPLQHFSLSTRKRVVFQECKTGKDKEGGRFVCKSHGMWACNPDWFGVNCQFEAPCDLLEINERYAPFADARSWSFGYSLLVNAENTPVQVYGRSAYIGNETHNDNVRDVMFFTGRRWVLTNTDLIKELKNRTDLNETIVSNYISSDFHAHWSEFEVVFISEAVDIDTPADGPTPVGLSWFRSKAQGKNTPEVLVAYKGENEQTSHAQATPIQAPDFNQDQDAVFLCASCNATSNPCLLGGTCSKDSHTRCDCITGSNGTLCQIAPTGDGRCNHHFNTAGYGWDGGDCCPATCKSAKYKCGTNESSGFGFRFDEYVGFPYCLDPKQLCDDHKQCWIPLVDLRGTIEGSEAGKFVAISGNGAVVAMASLEEISLVVRVFEQDGNEWKSRGEPLKASGSTSRKLQANADGSTTDSNPLVDLSSLVALSEDGSIVAFVANEMFHIYHWEKVDKTWNRPGVKSGNVGSFGSPVKSLALSNDGMVLAVDRIWDKGGDGSESHMHSVDLFRYTPAEEWEFQSGILTESPNAFGVSLSLSGSGHILAIGYLYASSWAGYYDTSSDGYVTVHVLKNDWSYAGLLGPPLLGSIFEDFVGYSVSLSSDGQILAVGSPNEAVVRVFYYNNTAMNWTQVGNEISSGFDGQLSNFGASVSLSGNGTILAVGMPYPEDVKDRVEVYAFRKGSWKRYGQTLRVSNNDGSGTSVAFSRDGSVLVFGAPQFDREKFGMAKVVWNTKTNAKNSSRTSAETDVPITVEDEKTYVPITIQIQLDTSPWQTAMRLICDGILLASIPKDSLSAQEGQVGNRTIPVPTNSFCTFEITDSEGDGIRRGKKGFYKIYYGNDKNETTLLAEGGELFGSSEKITFKVEPPSLVQINANIELSTSSLTSAELMLLCDANEIGNVLEVRAPPGAFQKSDLSRSATFLLPKGTLCRFNLTASIEGQGKRGSFDFYGADPASSFQKGIMNLGESHFVVPGCEACECAPLSPEPEPFACLGNETQVEFQLQSNENGSYASFGISADGIFRSSADRAHFSIPCSIFTEQACIPHDECWSYFVANTPIHDGEVNYTVRVGGDIVKTDTSFLGYWQSTIGDCPAPPTQSPVISDCDNDTALVLIELTTDRSPQDLSWYLWDKTSRRQILESEDYRSEKFFATTISKAICVAKDSCFAFTIRDLAGNGLCCDYGHGIVSVIFDSELVANASAFGSRYEKEFGDCDDVSEDGEDQSAGSESDDDFGCQDGYSPLYFEISMDANPHEIEWALFSGTGLIDEGSGYDRFTDAFETFTFQDCVPDIGCIELYIYDGGGDGLCCNYGMGSYRLSFGGAVIGSGSNFSYSNETQFQCNETITPQAAPTIAPLPLPSDEDCGSGYMLLRIDILLDEYPAETTWKVIDGYRPGAFTFVKGGPYEEDDAYQFIFAEECVPDDENFEFTFVIHDDYGDGICCQEGNGHFDIYLDNDLIHEGRGDFGSEQVVIFSKQEGAKSQMPVGTPAPSSLYPTMIPTSTAEPQLGVRSFFCPPTQPGPDDSCSKEGLKCPYGEEECCCGECFDSLLCSCVNGGWQCMDTDACLNVECPPTQVPTVTIHAPPEPDT